MHENALYLLAKFDKNTQNILAGYYELLRRNGFHYWVAHTTLLIDKPETIVKALSIVPPNFKPFKARIESYTFAE